MNEQYRGRANHLGTISRLANHNIATTWVVVATAEMADGSTYGIRLATFTNPAAAAALEGELKRRTDAAVAAVEWAAPRAIARIAGASTKRQHGNTIATTYDRAADFLAPFRIATSDAPID
jgi:hypothetical protein